MKNVFICSDMGPPCLSLFLHSAHENYTLDRRGLGFYFAEVIGGGGAGGLSFGRAETSPSGSALLQLVRG